MTMAMDAPFGAWKDGYMMHWTWPESSYTSITIPAGAHLILVNIGLSRTIQSTYAPQAHASPFFEWKNVTILSITSFNTVLAARPLHISMPVSFILCHPLQPCHFHNELNTSVFDNGECNGEVYFTGLAPHRCQTAVVIAWPPFWCSTCRLSPQIHTECCLSTKRASMLPMTPCTTPSLACMPCMYGKTTGFFFGLLIQSNNWIYCIRYTLY